jgi:transcription initiation factor TFIID subunit 7
MYDDPGSVVPQSDLDENGFYDDQGELEEGSDEEEYDDDLAAALREELAEGSDDNVASDAGDGSGDDEDEEGARSGDDEEDEDIAEKKAKVKQFTGEIKILEATIEKKRSGFTGGNPIMVKRFEETIAGLQADVNTKVSARQSILAELDSIAVAKAQAQKPVEAAKRSTGPVSAFTPDDRPQDDDEDEEEEEDGAYTAANTPTPAIAHREEEDDQDEDLFGDDDDEYETDNDDQAIAVSADEPAQSMPVLGDDGSSSEPEAEIDEEMAAMLAAEMSAMDDIEGNEEDTEAADAALRDLQSMDVELQEDDSNMDFGQDSFFDQKPTFGVEGGVGMRRLATGVMDEGDSDSDDSDD